VADGAKELEAAISEANVVLVFWCHHSNTSYEVRKEFALALEQGKNVLPCCWMELRCLADLRPSQHRLSCPCRRHPRGSPEQEEQGELAERVEVDRLIATDISRHYEELLLMSLAREIETELASRLGPN